ncbi:MAG: penicillin-binding protein [Levilactobacillus sp.]|uniref:transglycosylase domain-containing protein n=1 Tax=Levilactobacillus sp. TaxID=2767919 RepID=UPI0025869B77|nr:transglycosylase domain-containing protein [Levilactobacillus sp.]MCH4123398.1 penicillin-binding protein [Levilactobacillus sp.]MCI1552464.1 penicillin-binding protein [Levilactobacillus sp.]
MSSNNQTRQTRMSRNAERKPSGPKQPHTGWRTFRRILFVIVAIVVLGLLAGAGLFFFYAQSAPKITAGALSSDTSTRVYDANGQVISRLGAQNRNYVKNKNIPDTLKKAVVSTEDRRFYKNNGVDPIRIMGAAFANVTGSSLGMQGGSTLTQQLVKLSVFSTAASDRTLKRKAQEAWLALKVDHDYSKNQILEYYINKVYMGNGVYGMQTAAQYYYGKTLKHLNLAQLALLAGMPQSPTNYDPTTYPALAKKRRDLVLEAMAKNNVITEAQAQQAEATSITAGLTKTHKSTSTNPKTTKVIDAYLKQVYAELKSKGYNTTTGGLKVYTNLDMGAQKRLYDIVNGTAYVSFPSDKFQVGSTIVNPNNGKVVAMIGGRKTGNVTFGLNRAVQTDRSSASTAKPLMDYGPAIEHLYYPTYEPVKDTAFTYPGTNKSLYDWDRRYQGTITMRKALVESRNIPAVRTLQNVGIKRATSFLAGLGMTFDKTLTLQNGIGLYISSEQEAAAYAAFANGGTYYKPYLVSKVVTQDGKAHKYSSTGKKAMSAATAFMLTDMMKGVMTSANGSGRSAAISGLYQAGKTGTDSYPDDYANKVPDGATMDSWFTGYTKNYAISVWTGYDKQFETGHYVSETQTTIAQEIYKYEMSYLASKSTNTDWTAPSTVTETTQNGTKEYYITGHAGTVADTTATSQYGSTNTTSSSAYSSNSQVTTNSNTTQASSSTTESSTSKESSSTEQTPGGGNAGDDDDNTTSNSTSTTESSSATTTTQKSTKTNDNDD